MSENGNGAARRKILVIDDDVAAATALRLVLTDAGYDTRLCHQGSEAVRAADELQPDAAMVDIHLPDLNGLIISQQLRQRLGPDKPIIVVSGDTSMATLNSLSHVGATYFFGKPINVEMIVDRLREWLG